MNLLRQASVIAAAFVAGVVFVISCGDDAPRPADAATCDCAAAEPPITADRIVERKQLSQVDAMSQQTVGVRCELETEVALGGGCTSDVGSMPDVILQQSIPTTIGWGCVFKNPTNSPINVYAVVHCLKLAP